MVKTMVVPVVGWMVIQKRYVHVLILEPINVTLFGKGAFAEVNKLKNLRRDFNEFQGRS